MLPVLDVDGQPMKNKADPFGKQQRRRHDRFNGMSEDEVRSRTLPDHLTSNLDVVIVSVSLLFKVTRLRSSSLNSFRLESIRVCLPPTKATTTPDLEIIFVIFFLSLKLIQKYFIFTRLSNCFCTGKCLFLAGLVPEPMTADDDFKLLHFGIGFTNMVARPTKGSADLTRKEIREGGRILLEKLQQYRPKIAVFNGKGIYEVFSGKKEFTFGKQPECIDGTNTVSCSPPFFLLLHNFLVLLRLEDFERKKSYRLYSTRKGLSY